MPECVVDGTTGKLVLTRNHLKALMQQVSGTAISPELASELRVLGAVRSGELHPLLEPVLRVYGAAVGRAVVRTWVQSARPVCEVVVGKVGVLVLPGGHEMEAPQDLRWYPKPSAFARVLAEQVEAPAGAEGEPVFDQAPRPWSEVVARASTALGRVRVCDLRWAEGMGVRARSVFVGAWRLDGGLVSVEPLVGGEEVLGVEGPVVRCLPRHPLEVWATLTSLARQATAAASRLPPPPRVAGIQSPAEDSSDTVEGIR